MSFAEYIHLQIEEALGPVNKWYASENIRRMVRDLAYLKWVSSGRPCGQDSQFWLEAENELHEEIEEVNEPEFLCRYYIKSGGAYDFSIRYKRKINENIQTISRE